MFAFINFCSIISFRNRFTKKMKTKFLSCVVQKFVDILMTPFIVCGTLIVTFLLQIFYQTFVKNYFYRMSIKRNLTSPGVFNLCEKL